MGKVHVTDHVLIRYLERVKGFNLDPVRAEIAEKVRGAGKDTKSVTVGGETFKLSPCHQGTGEIVVVTVIDRSVHGPGYKKVIARSKNEIRQRSRQSARGET